MKFSLLILFWAFSAPVFAQLPPYPDQLPCVYVELKDTLGKDGSRLPFSRLRMIDVRSDTSKCGFIQTRSYQQYKYCFKDGAPPQFTRFMNNYLAGNMETAVSDEVVMYLRRFWFSQGATFVGAEYIPGVYTLHFKAEFFLHSIDGYHPLTRYDTAFTNDSFNPHNMAEAAVSAASEKLKRINYEKALSTRGISQQEIDEHYNSLFDVPALKTTLVRKGVYRTFEEFKQNRPSDTAFELKFESFADYLYVKDKSGTPYLEKNVWGVCDGQNVFIHYQNNFHQLFRHQNTWDLFFTNSKLPVEARDAKIHPFKATPKVVLAFQVNMDTGTIY